MCKISLLLTHRKKSWHPQLLNTVVMPDAGKDAARSRGAGLCAASAHLCRAFGVRPSCSVLQLPGPPDAAPPRPHSVIQVLTETVSSLGGHLSVGKGVFVIVEGRGGYSCPILLSLVFHVTPSFVVPPSSVGPGFAGHASAIRTAARHPRTWLSSCRTLSPQSGEWGNALQTPSTHDPLYLAQAANQPETVLPSGDPAQDDCSPHPDGSLSLHHINLLKMSVGGSFRLLHRGTTN